ncbi:MAG: L-threonylcarbamoyladenylate synthase [candidate division Zixibacteria bacterium]|nr:L-threonylcarbamoyladenylate synthase [candidate division Zixibacteria bacterium]
MKTDKIIKAGLIFENSKLLLQIISSLKNNHIIVAPTETRYGLLVRADNKTAIENLYEIKQRPSSMPTAVFVKSLKEIDDLAIMNEISTKLTNRFLPGPLTLVLNTKIKFPEPVVVNNKIGIRYSPSEIINKLVNAVDFPLTATSANLSGQNENETIEEIYQTFGQKVGFYLDEGRLNSLSSTVVDCSENRCRILRAGAIDNDEIMDLLNI